MSNRPRLRPPRRDAAVAALVEASRCDECGSTSALQKWDHKAGEWVITPLHEPWCPTRGRSDSRHHVSKNAVAGAREAGFRVSYVPYSDGSGGVVVDGEASPS